MYSWWDHTGLACGGPKIDYMQITLLLMGYKNTVKSPAFPLNLCLRGVRKIAKIEY